MSTLDDSIISESNENVPDIPVSQSTEILRFKNVFDKRIPGFG